MRRFVLASLLSGAFLIGAHQRALAMTEYCPAEILRTHALGVGDGAASALWAYTLKAFGSRTVSGTIVAQTDAGWFRVPFASVELPQESIEYGSEFVNFTRLEYESAPLYVRFPQPVKIVRWWVESASTTGDATFGWDAKGVVQCLPQAGLGISNGMHYSRQLVRNPPEVPLEIPLPNAPVATAAPFVAPSSWTSCVVPFVNARAVTQAQPSYPVGYDGVRTEVSVLVSIASDGTLDDAWIYVPSGITAFDREALRVAIASKYSGGTALCQPAAGQYLYVISFK